MKLLLCSFLFFLVIVSTTKGDFPADDDNVNWITIDSSNGATWEQFKQTYGQKVQEGILNSPFGFKFTESITYDVLIPDSTFAEDQPEELNYSYFPLLPYEEVGFSTASDDVTVQFNLPNTGISPSISPLSFIYCESCIVSMNGNFVFNGNGTYEQNMYQSNSNPNFLRLPIFAIFAGQLYLEHVTIENYFSINGAVDGEFSSITLDSVTFSNNKGLTASALAAVGGTVSLNDVTIDGSSVSSIAGGVGQMMFLGGASASGSVTTNNIDGASYNCNAGSCSIN